MVSWYADVRHAGANRRFNVRYRAAKVLPGQSVHQVDVDSFEAGERRIDRPARLAAAVDAPQRREHLLVEALHADRDAVHAGVAEAAEARRLDRAGARL